MWWSKRLRARWPALSAGMTGLIGRSRTQTARASRSGPPLAADLGRSTLPRLPTRGRSSLLHDSRRSGGHGYPAAAPTTRGQRMTQRGHAERSR